MIRIAAWQGPSVEDFDANMARVLEAIDRAGSQGADFLCFPETYLSNYGAGLAVHADDKRVHEMVRRSERFDMVVIVGLSELEAGRVLNTMLVIHQGRVMGKYRKTMLTGYDKEVFAPDYDLPVFEAKGIRFGVIVCHDSSFVEPALTMRWKGARLLFSPHFNRIPEDTADEHRILVRNNHVGLAALLQMVVVRANNVGAEPGKIGYGDSAIFSPLGVAVAQAPLFKEALIHADFDESVFREERWRTRAEIPMSVRDQLSAAMRAFGGSAGP
jgi:predicted amidohydrolase